MRIEMDKIYCGDSLQVLQTLPENAVDCCVTSPPYYALRDYGADGQIGREATPEEYVSRITAVFHEVKRVLTPEGTCWLNIADTYCGTGSKADHQDPKYPKGRNGQQVLQTLPENAVDCCVTSPPYYALRDYGADGQIGREATPEEYVSRITAVFHEVKRVLTPEGTCWLNIADTYCGTGSKADHQDPKYPKGRNGQQVAFNHRAPGCKPKDLIGIPWLVALALRGDGWYLRSSIIWHKGNAMPESTRDRPTRCYEYVFLLTKSKKYYYDWQAVAEPIAPTTAVRLKSGVGKGNKYAATVPGQNQPQKINRPRRKGAYTDELISPVRSRRNVWQINNVGYHGGHFAAFPPKLAETCILAGCPVGGIVLDPFLGSGTTAAAAKSLSRRYVGIEINPEYCTLAKQRIGGDEH